MKGDKIVKLSKESIDRIFGNPEYNHQSKVFVALYREVIPDYDNIRYIDEWPKVSNDTSQYIFEKFIEYDKNNHPEVLSGGLWMNCGFSTEKNVKNWTCEYNVNEFYYKGERNTPRAVYLSVYGSHNEYRSIQIKRDKVRSYRKMSIASWKRLVKVLRGINKEFIISNWKGHATYNII